MTPEEKTTLFENFSAAEREKLLNIMVRRRVSRGENLYATGDMASALYVVCHGRFSTGDPAHRVRAVAGAGEVMGDAAFFSRLGHNHTAQALRDSEVLELSREAYDLLAAENPAIAAGFLGVAARRLHQGVAAARPAAGETGFQGAVAIVSPGHADVPPEFFSRLRRILERRGAVVVDPGTISGRFGAVSPDDEAVIAWLNALERTGKTIVYLCDGEFAEWTERCIRQADRVMLVRDATGCPGPLCNVERRVSALHPPEARRLVLIHPRRTGVVSGTRAWLGRFAVGMHHHVSLQDDVDLQSLARFATGTAVGFVAGGGGGFGPAHIGVFRAFNAAGVTFDAFVGTSVGAAMVAGFSFLYDADQLDAGTHDIFVASRSFKRPTLPRYALLDHKVFDEALRNTYGADTMTEDCWRPFRAVATNLTQRRAEVIETGHLWKAVRASSAIPCVLPPFIDEDGTVYVDGGVMDDAPLAPMKDLKTGPNVAVHFGRPGEQRITSDYDAIPGRVRLLATLINPFTSLPRGPRPLGMLFRTMLAHQRYDLPAGEHDLVLTPPAPRGASVMNFDNHLAVSHAAYQWTTRRIAESAAIGDPAMAAILPPAAENPDNAGTNAA